MLEIEISDSPFGGMAFHCFHYKAGIEAAAKFFSLRDGIPCWMTNNGIDEQIDLWEEQNAGNC